MAQIPIPDGIIISDVSIDHFIPQFVDKSLNLKYTTKDRGIHQLQGNIQVTMPDERTIKRYESFLTKVRGRGNDFEIRLGGRFSAESHLTRQPIISADVGVGATEIPVKSIGGEVWEGDFIQFLNDSKVYIVQNDLKREGILKIFPALRVAQKLNSVTNMKDIVIRAKFDSDIKSIKYIETGKIGQSDIKWEESL